ncbi:sugar phosphate isomerase/epimerase [Superficieibacter sp.]|uniref:sugar phosphate isomerase/epimerase family protein n=1 Tax=Superficieibacter sp. TaxID=2303322 RepID=UPI0028B1B263|nr:sugar phosphate isomerase/epimerase [Superficieibacter sp.]
MKLGVFTPLFASLSLDEMLDKVQGAGLDAVEVGSGGNPGNHHCPTDELLASAEARTAYLEKFSSRGITISALSCHDNPISPIKAEREAADAILRKTIKLAGLLGVPVVNTFSGTAGNDDRATAPNWPVVPWPTVYSDMKTWQWENKLIPYWKEIGRLAEEHQVKIGIELHGGFLCHTPYTLLKLREETCDAIGANLDPSHLWWQGIDPVAAIKILGEKGAIHHFHAKDTYLDQDNINMYGLTDMQPYGNIRSRAWNFRTVGYGHSIQQWSDIISALRTWGYDYVISIEHEDALMSIDEGFMRAVTNLQSILIRQRPLDMWWA